MPKYTDALKCLRLKGQEARRWKSSKEEGRQEGDYWYLWTALKHDTWSNFIFSTDRSYHEVHWKSVLYV